MSMHKKLIYSGVVLEQLCFDIYPNTKDLKNAQPRRPTLTREEKDENNNKKACRRMIRSTNNNFTPNDYYVTLTQDDEHLVDTFPEAKKIFEKYKRNLQRINPNVKIIAVMGRGKRNRRIHFHMVISGVIRDDISEKWKYGRIKEISHLREHNYYDRIDHGADYTGLAVYMFDHWTPEQGKGKRYFSTQNLDKVENLKPTPTKRTYDENHPPITPKGYIYVGCSKSRYGHIRFKYVVEPKKSKFPQKRKRPKKNRENNGKPERNIRS